MEQNNKLNKTGQDQKSMISDFAYLLNVITKVLFVAEGLETRLIY